MSVSLPQPSREAAESFLRGQVRDAIHLVSIEPDGPGLSGRYFGDDAAGAAEWAIAENSRQRNVYWTVNQVRPDCGVKPKKSSIAAARFVHVDIDPPKNGGEFDRTTKLLELDLLACPPSLIIDSGNGLQALWRLEPSVPDWRAIEDINRGAESVLGADHCHNIDRLLRIPGTVNYPDKKKQSAGRVPVLATSISCDDVSHTAEALAELFPPIPADKKTSEKVVLGDVALITADDLDLPDLELIRAAIERPKGEDRSDDGFHCACLMLHAGATPEQVAGILLNPENAVSGHYLDQSIPERAVRRAIESARAAVKSNFPTVPPEKPRGLHYLRLDEIEIDFSPLYLVKGMLDQGEMSVMYGDSNSGKTFLALDIAYAIAAGREWHGRRVKKGLVVYVAAEGGRGIHKRLIALRERYGSAGTAFALVPCSVDLLRPNGDTAGLIALIKKAEAEFGEPAILVVIDTLSRALAGGDENASNDMGAFIKNVDKIRSGTSAHTLVIHHCGKDAAKGARGHTSLRAATDTEIEIAERTVTVTKQRNLDREPAFPFGLEVVTVGTDDEGMAVTSCLVHYPAKADADMSPDMKLAIEALRQACADATPEGADVGSCQPVSFNAWSLVFKAKKGCPQVHSRNSYADKVLRTLRTIADKNGWIAITERNQYYIP
jgi:hypothetical protein